MIIYFIALSSVTTVLSIVLHTDQSTLYVKQGDAINLSCTTDADPSFLTSYPLRWEKVGRDGSRVAIATLKNVVESLKDHYSITSPSTQQGQVFVLNIVNGAEFKDDGFFKCMIKDWRGSVIVELQLEVIVMKNIEKITFTINNTEIDQTSNQAEPIFLEEGNFEPVCRTMGSNPASIIKMYLNDIEIGYNEPIVSVKDKTRTSPPQVFNTEKKVLLKLTPDDKNKTLKCVAKVYEDPAMQQEVSFKLDIFNVCRSSFNTELFVNIDDTLTLPCQADNYRNAKWTGPCLNTERCKISNRTQYYAGFQRHSELPQSITLKIADHKDGFAYDLIISPVSMNTLGLFSCYAFLCNDLIKWAFEVILKVKPSNPVINMMMNGKLTGTVGIPLDLVCTVTSGTPLEKMTWYKDESIVAVGGPGMIRYSFVPGREDNGQNWSCVVQSDALATPLKRIVKLDIKYRPVVEWAEENVSITEGNTYTVQCIIHSNPSPVVVIIYRHGALLKQCFQSPCSLKLKSSRNDSGEYMCTAQNQIGNGTICQAVVNILYPPVVSVIILNDTALRCCASGEPNNITYLSWHHVNELGEVRLLNGSEYLKLCLSCKRYMVNGWYTCSATNGIRYTDGNNISFGNVSVQFGGTPEILPKTNSVRYGKYRKPITLEIFIYSTTLITIDKISRNGEVIESSGRLATSGSFKNEHTATYNITHLQEVDFAFYTFKVKNDQGEMQFSVSLEAKDNPESPDIKHLIVKDSDVTVHFSDNFDGGLPQVFVLQYRSILNWTSVEINDTFAGFGSYTIKNLECGHMYYFRMYSVNSVGKSSYSEVRSIVLSDDTSEGRNSIKYYIGISVGSSIVGALVSMCVYCCCKNIRKRSNLNVASMTLNDETEAQYDEIDDEQLHEMTESRVNQRQDSTGPTNPEIEAETENVNLNIPSANNNVATEVQYNEIDDNNLNEMTNIRAIHQSGSRLLAETENANITVLSNNNGATEVHYNEIDDDNLYEMSYIRGTRQSGSRLAGTLNVTNGNNVVVENDGGVVTVMNDENDSDDSSDTPRNSNANVPQFVVNQYQLFVDSQSHDMERDSYDQLNADNHL